MGDRAWRDEARAWWERHPPGVQGLLLLVASAVAGTLVLSAPGGHSAGPGSARPSAAPHVAESPLLVHVAGEVAKPGLYRLRPGARIADALEAAGGTTAGADVAALNLARYVEDGEQVLVPGPAPAAGSGGAQSGGKLHLNRASAAELDALPGIGPVLASRIVAFREAKGGFRSVRDLRRVQGIGDKLYRALAELVTV